MQTIYLQYCNGSTSYFIQSSDIDKIENDVIEGPSGHKDNDYNDDNNERSSKGERNSKENSNCCIEETGNKINVLINRLTNPILREPITSGTGDLGDSVNPTSCSASPNVQTIRSLIHLLINL